MCHCCARSNAVEPSRERARALDRASAHARTCEICGVTPFPDSLCHRCRFLRLVESGKGSTFLMCLEPTLPKYGPQPVRQCRGFVPRESVKER